VGEVEEADGGWNEPPTASAAVAVLANAEAMANEVILI